MNTLKHATLTLLVLTVAAACDQAGTGTTPAGGINFVDGIAAGKAQAKAQSKPMFVFFTGDY